jgi:hypothetical protein
MDKTNIWNHQICQDYKRKKKKYIGIEFGHTVKGKVLLDMVDHGNQQITSPWNENPIQVHESSPGLTKDMVEQFPKVWEKVSREADQTYA